MSLKDRIQSYFERHPNEWIASGTFQRFVSSQTSYTPANVSRRLRELENEGILKVAYKKNHAYYQYVPAPKQAVLIS